MTYIAKFITIAKIKNITDKFKPFIAFHSALEKIETTDEDRVIILQIEGTESYFPIFLTKQPTIEQIESKLEKLETRLNNETKKLLVQYLEEASSDTSQES